jgi:dihydroorotase/N-acyl-D-amino-acid deacylase
MVIGFTRPEWKKYEGKRIAEIARDMGESWPDAVVELTLGENDGLGKINFTMSEENVRMQLRNPWVVIGTDAGGFDPDSASGMTHPRAYGSYPRILGRYVREDGVLRLEDAVRRMTSGVASRLSIRDRGLVREGLYADLVVFDEKSIIDRATPEQPHQISTGVKHVWVNGVQVLRDGVHTGAKPGRALRGPGYRKS